MKAPTRRATRPSALNPEIQPLVENLEILNGARGNGLDRAVLLRDLVNLGLASTSKTGGGKLKPTTPGGGGTTPKPDDPTVEEPTIPTGVYASGGFSNILIAWDSPAYKGHAYADVYRSATDDYSKAVNIAQTAANLYSDSVSVDTTWYYWIRFVNKNDKEGPIQSTSGVEGKTSAAIGDILEQLKGEIDETFFTPVFNTRLNDTDKEIQRLFGDVTNIDNKFTDKFVQVEDQFVEFDDKFIDVSSILEELKSAGEIIAEAAMEASVGVEIESDTRRKITAKIEERQRTIITDQIAMAEDIKVVTASVDDNKAQISITNTALVELDKDTKEAVKTITERLDTQQSNIDDNKASITNQQQTLVSVKDSVNQNTGEIDKTKKDVQAVTTRLDTQQSEIDDNKATITTQQQTIVTIDGKVTGNAGDIKDTADKVEVITQRVDTLTSEVGDNKALISQTQQTLITIDGKVTDNEKEIGDNAESIQVVTTRIDKQQSEIDSNKATITSQSQTIIKIDGKVKDNTAEVAKAISSASNAQATADGKIDTFFQGSHPANASEGDIWFDTSDGNKQYVYHNGGWVVAQDTEIGDAIKAAASAQATADGKIETFYQPSEPQGVSLGDLWVDTDDKNRLYRWNGSQWADIQDGEITDVKNSVQVITQKVDELSSEVEGSKALISQLNQTIITVDGKTSDNKGEIDKNAKSIEVVTTKLDKQQSEINTNKASITTQQQTIVRIDGEVQGNKTGIAGALAAAADAKATADGKIDTFFQNETPLSGSEGDIWFDTNDGNKQYVFSNGGWVVAQDTEIGDAILAAAGAQATADGKIETFYQDNQPTAKAPGDLWVDTDDKNKLYRWSGSAWVDIHDKSIDEIKGDVEIITQRVDTMKSEVDNNTAEITDTKQTLVTIDGKVTDNTSDIAGANQSITTMTKRLESQQSEIDGNKASITSQAQTIVTIDGKVNQNASDIDTTNKSIETITQKQDEQKSELDGAKAVIESNSQTIARIEGELGDEGVDDGAENILAEAVMSTAMGVDNEGSTRRKVSARIEKQQRVIMTDQAAMAQDITKITASVGDNEAAIQSVNTALVEFDKETDQALKIMTERLDTQQSNIDENKASITTQSQTIVRIDGEVTDNKSDIIESNKKLEVITERVDTLKSEVDGNTASISTNSQTIIEVNEKAEDNKAKINVVSQQLTTVESELGDTKSAVSTNSQTIAKMNADGTTAYEAQWGVKASVGDIQAGIGLVAKKNPDGSTVSQCTVLADQFSVGHVKSDGSGETIYPFIVTSEGIYMDTAYIKAATIQDLVAGEVVADTIKAAAELTAPKIKGGTIEAMTITGTYVQSDNYLAGRAGYKLTPNSAEFNSDVTVNAMIQADRIVGDIVCAITKVNGEVVSLSGTTGWVQSGIFGSVSVKNARNRNRTMIINLGLTVQFERGEALSQGAARIRVTGTYGDFYSRDILTPEKNSDSGGKDPYFSVVTIAIPIPANRAGKMNIYVQSRKTTSSRSCKIYGRVSAPTTSNIWSAQLITNGGDLA